VIADIICVGNELLTGLIENSNSGYLARRLNSCGIAVREVTVIADQDEAIKTPSIKRSPVATWYLSPEASDRLKMI